RYVEELNNKGYEQDRIKRMSIIDCDNINMANLCIVTSHSVNGVAKLHTHILETEVLKDFYQDEPNKFNSSTYL
ncbi:glycogen/starch/alpha-glucan phosphorylase, partial [Clostridioides difficile]|uniref:glycogen/starch/alpha-glucan phosphorylase n=1 Tax=Clostridioides difficile TaxID=1496 RepID=UPI0021142F4C